MIVRRDLKVSFIARLTWRFVLGALLLGVAAAVLSHRLGLRGVLIPPIATTALGTALAIFLGFRNNAAYDRWWEARRQWGQLINSSRSFARQVLSLVDPGDAADEVRRLQRALVHRQIAWAHALRLHLRRQPDHLDELAPLLPEGELEAVRRSSNVPLRLHLRQAEELARLRRDGRLSDLGQVRIDETLGELAGVQGACERIKNTPLPRQYSFYTRLFVYIYCAFLPFALVGDLGWRVPILSVPISFLFLALERVASVNEDPFENRIQDTPMSALCRTIEINLRELLGEADLPRPLEPVDGYLF